MTKREFLSRLNEGLSGLPQEDAAGRLAFYSEMIDDRIEDGLSEEEAVAGIGPVEKIVAQIIEDSTSGYPFLVSRICQLLDGDQEVQWNKEGIGEIVRRILMEKNTLFDSLMGKVHDNDRLREILYRILFAGEAISYNPDDISISDAEMFGFVRNS